VENIDDYQENLKRRALWKDAENRILKLAMYYKPVGKRNRDHLRKRLKNQFLDEGR
jgi:hypothetical protein